MSENNTRPSADPAKRVPEVSKGDNINLEEINRIAKNVAEHGVNDPIPYTADHTEVIGKDRK